MRLAFAADAGRVDKPNLAAFVLDDFVDGIPRGSGDRRHDSAIDSCEFIEQRGLADIRVPDDSHPDFMRLLRS